MHPVIIFLLGMMAGGSLGVLVAGLLRAARDGDAPEGREGD